LYSIEKNIISFSKTITVLSFYFSCYNKTTNKPQSVFVANKNKNVTLILILNATKGLLFYGNKTQLIEGEL